MRRDVFYEIRNPQLGKNMENPIYNLESRNGADFSKMLSSHYNAKDWIDYNDFSNSNLRNRLTPLCLQQNSESLTSLTESEFCNEESNCDDIQITREIVAKNLSRFGRFLDMLSRLPLPIMSFTGMGLCFLLAIFICPRMCCENLVFPVFRLAFGTLYPAYASYKAVRTKNVKEYVKWMMYWIVYAFFTCVETFTDIFLSWFPFYYELKVIIVLWLLSPATKGSSTLYRKFVHPMLTRREQEIDEYLNQARERGYTAVLQLGSKGVNYATNVIMQTALKGGGNLVQTIRRSYSLSDLSEPDVNRTQDEIDEVVRPPRFLRPRSQTVRSSSGGRQPSNMYFSEVEMEPKGPPTNYNYIRSSEDISSGYSSAEPISGGLSRTSSMTNTRSRFKAKRAEDKNYLDADIYEIARKPPFPLHSRVNQSDYFQNINQMQGNDYSLNVIKCMRDETYLTNDELTVIVEKDKYKETNKSEESIDTCDVKGLLPQMKYKILYKWLRDNEESPNSSSEVITINETDTQSSDDEFKDTLPAENEDFFDTESEIRTEKKSIIQVNDESKDELKTYDGYSKTVIGTILTDNFHEICRTSYIDDDSKVNDCNIKEKELETKEPCEEIVNDTKIFESTLNESAKIVQINEINITNEKVDLITCNKDVLVEKELPGEILLETKQSLESFVPTNLATNIRELSSSIEKINEQILEACKKPNYHGKRKAPSPPNLLLKKPSRFESLVPTISHSNESVNLSSHVTHSEMTQNTSNVLNLPIDPTIQLSNESVSYSQLSSPKLEEKKSKKKTFRSYLPSLFRSDPPKSTAQPIYNDYHKETQI